MPQLFIVLVFKHFIIYSFIKSFHERFGIQNQNGNFDSSLTVELHICFLLFAIPFLRIVTDFFFNIGSVINELFFFSYKMFHQHHWLCRLVREVCSYKVYCLNWCRGSFTLNMCTSLFALLHNALFVNNNNRYFIVIIINCCLIFMTVFQGSTNF